MALPAQAQGLIRDAEIERTLKMVAGPVLRAAALSPVTSDILIVSDQRLNAFVAGGDDIFVNAGLLQRLETIDQVRAVLAHEAGHITGGHIARRNTEIRKARGTTALGVLLSVAAAAAGSAEAAIAIGSLSNETAMRNLLAHSRSEETSADQAGLRYLSAAGGDPQAMMEVMRLFRGQEFLSASSQNPYVRTHPLWTDRIRYLEERIANTPRGRPPSEEEVYWHARMVAKLDAFLLPPARVLHDAERIGGETGALARAIGWHRLPDRDRAAAAMRELLDLRPEDPFYHELDGQFRLENGDAAGAVAAYRRATELAPEEGLILGGLGRALVAVGTDAAMREALEVLTRARLFDRADHHALRALAVAHARTGSNGQASLATAERLMLEGRIRDAAVHAGRAQTQLPVGTPAWRQADDILRAARRADQ